VSPASAFTDVKTNHPFYNEITWASNNGIVNGYPDQTFRGAGHVTRQAMSAFLFRFIGNPEFVPSGQHYVDVPPDHPFYLEVEWMRAAGIGSGYGDGTFRPGQPVTRQAVAAYFYRLLEEPAADIPINQIPWIFLDVPPGHPFTREIFTMWALDLSRGYNTIYGPAYQPGAVVTRQAATAFIYRLYVFIITASTSGAERSVPGDGPLGDVQVPQELIDRVQELQPA
jgi:hypothetical protein